MSTIVVLPPPVILLDTPRGRARLVSAGTNCHGLDIVRVRLCGTGSPWTFERYQVTRVKDGAK